MRAPLILALAVAVSLSACNNAAPPPPPPKAQVPAGPPPVPADATALRGKLNIAGLNDLPKGLQLHLRLLDMTDPSIVPPVVAERREPAPTSLPADYALPFDSAKINEEGRYVLEATLTADEFVMYSTPAPMPVLTQGGAPATAKIPLELSRGGPVAAPDMAPADVLKGEFERLEGSIGGMRRLTGQRIENNVTVGWDAFADASGVRFVREVIDFGDAGTGSFRYAFRDGKPWVIAREQGGKLTLVGWNDEGTLLLNRVGENNGGADEADVRKLREMAEAAHKIAAAKA